MTNLETRDWPGPSVASQATSRDQRSQQAEEDRGGVATESPFGHFSLGHEQTLDAATI